MYRENPLGNVLATGPVALPRWAYMMIGSLGVSGIGFLLLGLHQKVAPETGAFLTRQGGRFLAIFTIVQMVMGYVVFHGQAENVRAGLSGSTYYLALAAVWGLTAVLLIVLGLVTGRASAAPSGLLAAGAGVVSLVNILAMAGFRDGIRDVTLALHGFDVWKQEVNTNWLNVVLFLLLFVAAGVAIGWLTRVVFQAKGESASYG
jgi:hypothetical protein